MAPTLYALVSSSPRVSFETLGILAVAYQKQMNEDLAPAYGREPWTILPYPSKELVPKPGESGFGDVVAYDHVPKILDVPGAAAYHTEDEHGRAWGVGGVDAILDAPGGSLFSGPEALSIDGSHELCETFADEDVSAWTLHASGLYLLAKENSDPTQGDSYLKACQMGTDLVYVDVSNFVFPAYFDPQAPAGTRLDQMGLVSIPGEIRPGGYQSQLHAGDYGYFVCKNVFGDGMTAAARARVEAKLAGGYGRAGYRKARHAR